MPRRLIICSDGTWNEPESLDQATNVLKTARAVRPEDDAGDCQIVFYDWGVGTRKGSDRVVGGAFGVGLNKNILDAYRFLVHNHLPGDEIWLFGFSRGAYTVRSLVGLIRNCGLLRKAEAHRIEQAFAHYRSRDPRLHPDAAASVRFRRDFSREVTIRFLGVWDTVGSLGIPLHVFKRFNTRRHSFHDLTLTTLVEHAYHALAIDEKRRPFRPAVWRTKPGRKDTAQVWFTGVHSNIGGGYPFTGLSNRTLLWMAERAEACGLALDRDYLAAITPASASLEIGRPFKGFYRLLGAAPRPIGRTNPHDESVHESALRRLERDAGYRPPNLARYIAARTEQQEPMRA